LFTPLTGKLADIFSSRPVLAAIAIIPLLTLIFVGYLFRRDS
jgi:hypothetical protein